MPRKLSLLVSLLIITAAQVFTNVSFAAEQEAYTRIIIFRHAPKIENPSPLEDLGLNEEGLRRAEGLTELGSHYKISGIYSTNFKRTIDTVLPLANKADVKVDTKIGPVDFQGYLNDILANHKNKTVVVVGHSNTVPGLVNHMVPDANLENLEHDAYDDIFIVKYYGSGHSELMKMKYQVTTVTSHSLFLKD